jgi:hypothetical protein
MSSLRHPNVIHLDDSRKDNLMRSKTNLVKQNSSAAKRSWPTQISRSRIQTLGTLTRSYQFSVVNGDLLLLDNGWYVTHTGLIRLAARRRCRGIQVNPIAEFSDMKAARYAFKATVFKSSKCQGFAGYGDADPSNVSFLVHGAEMRVAETRAVNRALRKAYGIGICSVEEIGSLHRQPSEPAPESKKLPQPSNDGNGHSSATVRDRLYQIIRQHELDPNLVKPYAADFCGVKTLRDATRDQVEGFVQHLADWAEKDRNALLCQLNSYMPAKDGVA